MRYITALLDALEVQARVATQIAPPQLGVASPCGGWTVREVMNHSVGVTMKFTAFASGATDEPHAPAGDLLGADHGRSLRAAAERAAPAWACADTTRWCRLAFGTFPAEVAAGINLFDVLAHTWDMAVATSTGIDGAGELWDIGLEAAQRVIGTGRDTRHFGPAVPVDRHAPSRTRFLGFLGRTDG